MPSKTMVNAFVMSIVVLAIVLMNSKSGLGNNEANKPQSLKEQVDDLSKKVASLTSELHQLKGQHNEILNANAKLILGNITVTNINPGDPKNNQRYRFSFLGPNGEPNRGIVRALKVEHYVVNHKIP